MQPSKYLTIQTDDDTTHPDAQDEPTSTANLAPHRREKKTPKDYSDAVSRHSARASNDTLFTGIHYRSLVIFLAPRTVTHPSVKFESRPHVDVILHDLGYPRADPRSTVYFRGADDPQRFMDHELPHDNAGQLLFVRGYPSPDWVKSIGARYRVDPELFRRHLQYIRKSEYFELPATASSSLDIIKLSASTLGLRSALKCEKNEQETRLEDHFKKLGQRPDVVGESIVRRLWIHDEQHFSIEQHILISVMRRGDGWLALVLLDNGRDLDEGPSGPWLSTPTLNTPIQKSKYENVFLPTIQFESRTWSSTLDCDTTNGNGNTTPATPNRPYAQSASLLPTKQYGQFLDADLMKLDPFYALYDVFSFCAHAESQFLNALKLKAEAAAITHEDEMNLQMSLVNFRYHKGIIRQKIEQLNDTVKCIRLRGNPKWPSAKGSLGQQSRSASIGSLEETLLTTMNSTQTPRRPSLISRANTFQTSLNSKRDSAFTSLLRDYEDLLGRAKSLSLLYSEEIDHIRTSVALLEARKSLEYNKGIGRLTVLAFFFLPLTFTTGIFGMNLHELGTELSVWVWVAVSVLVFGAALVLYYWPGLSDGMRAYLAKPKRKRKKNSQIIDLPQVELS